jgi:nucleoside-diphosphate-sugar epimerase
MRVFIAGATGAIGRELLALLVTHGHEVTGMTREPGRAPAIEAGGAAAAVCDAYDAEALSAAVQAARPDVVVHLLTALPQRLRPRTGTPATDRLRREGTRALLAAARDAGAGRVVVQSVAFLCEPGDGLAGDDAPLFLDAPAALGRTVAAIADLERQALASPGALVLRLGWLYGPGTWYARDGSIARDVRRRLYPVVGPGTGVWSFVHVDDAAAACVAAVESGLTGTCNVVDDEPAPMRDWLPAYARAIGAPRPLRVPVVLARLVAGRGAAVMAVRMRGAANDRAARELGWRPARPSWRAGFAG